MSLVAGELHWVQRAGTRMRGLHRPTTLTAALQLLAGRPDLRPVAGGTDLVLELARSEAGGEVDLVDLSNIDGFGSIDLDDPDHVRLAAGVTHASVVANPELVDRLLPLAQACLEIGSPQLRNRATIVGNVVTASPANDTISALLALRAELVIARLETADAIAARVVPLGEFYDGFRSTVLAPGELVTEIRIPQPGPGQRGIWVKAGLRKAQAISVVHAGLVLDVDSDGVISAARIALGSVGPTVALSAPAADALEGNVLSPAVIAEAADAAAASVAPIDDGRATAEYRTESVRTVVSRALQALAANTQSSQWPARVPVLSVSAEPQPLAIRDVPAETDITAMVHGEPASGPAVGTGTLLDWVRDVVGTGTKEGCAEGECGACTVTLDGAAVMSCLVPAAQADGASITTIEGLAPDGDVHPISQAFVDRFAVQCGYCIPGFIVAAERLQAELDRPPSRDEIELALSGNLCRCTGYYNIIDAVERAFSADQQAKS